VSMLDPQILFLNVFLSALFGGTCYFIYAYLLRNFFGGASKNKTQRSRKQPARTKSSAQSSAGNYTSDSDKGGATTSGVSYDESWIPKEHLQRPEAKRVRSGTPKTKAK